MANDNLETTAVVGFVCRQGLRGLAARARRLGSPSTFTETIRPLFTDAVDNGIGFAYSAAFVAGPLERLVCRLAPDIAQSSFRQLVVAEGIGISQPGHCNYLLPESEVKSRKVRIFSLLIACPFEFY
jgi:hypothetical protein